MSLKQQNNYTVTFFTHSGAVAYRRYLEKIGIKSEMMPVPRILSSSCGVCLNFDFDDILQAVTTDVDSIYTVKEGKYSLIYESEE